MSLRIGVVGVGAMGAAHVRTLATQVRAARVVAVHDADGDRAAQVAGGVSATAARSALGLVEDPEVDAVVVASPDGTHADLVLACLRERKPVLCEKPLGLTVEQTLAVVEAEAATGRRWVQVGFMRRFDPAFEALRETTRAGSVGTPRVVHCVHRNASSATSTTSEGLITGSMVHELDTVRWLLADEIVSVDVRSPVREGFADPQVAVLQTASGVVVTVEVFVNARYGYDVGCEVVGTRGVAALAPPRLVTHKRTGALEHAVADTFLTRFADAYRAELDAWVESALGGPPVGAGAWDGHVAQVVATAAVESLRTGRRAEVPLPTPPTP